MYGDNKHYNINFSDWCKKTGTVENARCNKNEE